MSAPAPQLALHRFVILTAAATFLLVGVGGLVTSHGVGMAVPDWPNTYGYNMFFFPISKWIGGIFYEHTHRLVASGVGLLTMVLAVWVQGRPARPWLRWGGVVLILLAAATWVLVPRRWSDSVVLAATGLAAFGASWVWPRCEPASKMLRRFAFVLFLAVVLQGVLGGLRVVLYKDQLGIFHATLAQLFFAGMCALALWTSGWWTQPQLPGSALASSKLRKLFLGTTLLILLQLVLGATMRHQHAGLSIPDFPLAYGKLWPPMDPASVAHYNQQRVEVTVGNPITATQIGLQMVHRLVALVILAGVALCAWHARKTAGPNRPLRRLTLAWCGLLVLQVILGAATIWSNKAADIATAHVLAGAASLALGVLLNLVATRQACAVGAFVGARDARSETAAPGHFGVQPATANSLR